VSRTRRKNSASSKFRVPIQLWGRPLPDDEANPASPASTADRRMSPAARHARRMALLLVLLGGAPFVRFDGVLAARASQSADFSPRPFDIDNPIQEERRLRALNAERQKSMVKDADKLLKLARELDAEVNRPTPALYDQAEFSKIAEIEKLAHKVKEKMSTSVRTPSDFRTIPPASEPR